jgi:hypothetical protein
MQIRSPNYYINVLHSNSKCLKIRAGTIPVVLALVLALLAHLQCSCIILPWMKNSWTPVHDLLHCLSMFLDLCFTFSTSIINRVSFQFYQVFKICISSGLLPNSLVNYLFHLRLFNYRHLFNPFNFLLIL